MKLDARQLVARVLPRREDPPPPYSQRDPNFPPSEPRAPARAPGVPLTRSLSPRPLLPSSEPERRYAPLSTSSTHLIPSPAPHSPPPAIQSPSSVRSHPPHIERSQPSPAYTPCTPRHGPASFSTLPVALVHRILMLALDPSATPDVWAWDLETERVRRLHWLFLDVRAVNRRLYLIATSILRDRLLPTYTARLHVHSSAPLRPGADATGQPVFAARSREAAVLDRFVAMRLGEDLRRLESTLSEDSGEEEVLFARLQPAARVEDLLLHLPPHLITPPPADGRCLGELRQALPLPHAHVAVTLSPLWAQLWLSYSPVNVPNTRGGRAGRSLVVEVRREKSPEVMVKAFSQALEWLSRGRIAWGWSVRSSG